MRSNGLKGRPRPKLPGPALSVIEIASISRGMVIADAMVKKAQIHLMQSSPITPGKFLIIISGEVEEVSQAQAIACELSQGTLVDYLFLAQPHPQLFMGIQGESFVGIIDALGIIETFSVAATILAADKTLKTADVHLVQMRLARGLGGRAFFIVTGALPDIEAAIQEGRTIIHGGMLMSTEIIPKPHPEFVHTLAL